MKQFLNEVCLNVDNKEIMSFAYINADLEVLACIFAERWKDVYLEVLQKNRSRTMNWKQAMQM